MRPATVGELIETLKGYVLSGELDNDSPIRTELKRVVRRQVRHVGTFAAPNVDLIHYQNGEKELVFHLMEPGLFYHPPRDETK